MSATIPESMRLDDLLKATGYNCPVDLQGKTFDQATEGGGGDVPTEWYLWQDEYGDYQYLPFATAPDTLDSLKLVFIGKKLAKDTEIETYGVAEYTKNSDTEFFFTDNEPNPESSTFTRITEDVPIGGGADLENNKEATIDVSAYTEPVEITPTQGKDGMKKATVTLSNIPTELNIEDNKKATIDVSTYTEPVKIYPSVGKETMFDAMEQVTVTLSNIPSVGTPELGSFEYNETAGGVNIGDALSLQLFAGRDNIAISSAKSVWAGAGFATVPLTSLLNGETVDVDIQTGPGKITITLSYDGNSIVTGTVKAKENDYFGTEWYLGAYQIVST